MAMLDSYSVTKRMNRLASFGFPAFAGMTMASTAMLVPCLGAQKAMSSFSLRI